MVTCTMYKLSCKYEIQKKKEEKHDLRITNIETIIFYDIDISN